MKKKVTAPLSYDPGKGRPKEHLAYLNWQEMQQLQRLNGGNMERGPRGLPSFPPADAIGSSSRAASRPSVYSSGLSRQPSRGFTGGNQGVGGRLGGGGADRGVSASRADASRQAAARQAAERSRAEARARAEESANRAKRDRDERARRDAEARRSISTARTSADQQDEQRAAPTFGQIKGAISGVASAAPIPRAKPDLTTKKSYTYSPPSDKIPTMDEVKQHLFQEAAARNINPDDVFKGVKSEGWSADPEEGWQSRVKNKKGERERSYGIFQLNTDQNRLGAQFAKATGQDPRDPRTWRAQTEFSLDYAAQQGGWGNRKGWTWFGPRDSGMSKTQGFSKNSKPIWGASSQAYTGPTSRSLVGFKMSQQGGAPATRSATAQTTGSFGPAIPRGDVLSGRVNIIPASAPGVRIGKTPDKALSKTESAYRDPFAVAGKRAILSTTPASSIKVEKINESKVEPDTPPGYFAQFAITPNDMEDLKGRAIKDYGLFSKQLAEMNKNKDALPAFFGPISRDVDRMSKQKSPESARKIGTVANKYQQPPGPFSPRQMADSVTRSMSGVAGGISDLFGISRAEAATPEGAILARGYSPYGVTGTERRKQIYDRVMPSQDTVAPRKITQADSDELNYGVMVETLDDGKKTVSNMMRSTETAPAAEREELERMRLEEIEKAAKLAGFRPSVYGNEEFLSDRDRLGMMSEPPGDISPTDMAKIVSRALGTQIPEKYGEEFDGNYLTRSEKDRLAASNVIQRVMKLNPLSRLAIMGAEKIIKPEDVEKFLARPSYEQEELYRLGREMDERYGRRPMQEVAGQPQNPQVPGQGYDNRGQGGQGGGIGGLAGYGGAGGVSGGGMSGGGGSSVSQSGGRPYIYYQWDVGVNIPSPGDPDYTNYQEYLRQREEARAA